jgi:hypothetical protein
MSRTLKLPREALPSIRKLVELGADRLDEIDRRLSGIILLRADDLETLLRGWANDSEPIINEDDAQVVAEALVSFGFLSRDDSAEASFASLTEALRSHGWDQISAWEGLQAPIVRLLASPALRGLAKTIDLQYQHANMLTDAHIVTDVRPVFNIDASKATAAIICQTIRVAYISDGRTRHIAFALTVEDIRKLRDQCDRALRKSEVMAAYLASPMPLKACIAGDS